jgi:anti-sigma regulatory factor (Ser/Thr protein kinase)
LEVMMIRIPVTESSQVAEARRRAAELAETGGFSETDAGRVALVATEMATNLIKHGGGGDLLAGSYADPTGTGIELIALDQGAGMARSQHCIADGYSSVGTAGHGFGAIIRQSHFVDIGSWLGLGTAVLARLEAGNPPASKPTLQAAYGAVSVALPGEDVCGDSWSVVPEAQGLCLLAADGLGHGPHAAAAAVQAVRLFRGHSGHRIPTILEYIHGGMRSTRGAAIAIARLDEAAGKVEFGGVGNIAGAIVSDTGVKRMVSLAGTAGHNMRTAQSFDYPFNGGLVLMHSDGLSTGWSLERYPGLAHAHPTLIASVLFRDYWRQRDDVTVLVARGAGVT